MADPGRSRMVVLALLMGLGLVLVARLVSSPNGGPANPGVTTTAASTGTISWPNGSNASGTIFQQAMPNGIPMIVMHKSRPATRCASASSQPTSTSQMTLPITDQTPASRRNTVVRPNGQMTKPARRKAAMPNGIVMMRIKATIPATT